MLDMFVLPTAIVAGIAIVVLFFYFEDKARQRHFQKRAVTGMRVIGQKDDGQMCAGTITYINRVTNRVFITDITNTTHNVKLSTIDSDIYEELEHTA